MSGRVYANLDEVLGRLSDWTYEFGRALCPRLGEADSYGDGVRAAKAQVATILGSLQVATPSPAPAGLTDGEVERLAEIGRAAWCEAESARPSRPKWIAFARAVASAVVGGGGWPAFIAAGWTREPPTQPGCYPVAWKDGSASVLMVSAGGPPDMIRAKADWYWAAALPELPDPPCGPSDGEGWAQPPPAPPSSRPPGGSGDDDARDTDTAIELCRDADERHRGPGAALMCDACEPIYMALRAARAEERSASPPVPTPAAPGADDTCPATQSGQHRTVLKASGKWVCGMCSAVLPPACGCGRPSKYPGGWCGQPGDSGRCSQAYDSQEASAARAFASWVVGVAGMERGRKLRVRPPEPSVPCACCGSTDGVEFLSGGACRSCGQRHAGAREVPTVPLAARGGEGDGEFARRFIRAYETAVRREEREAALADSVPLADLVAALGEDIISPTEAVATARRIRGELADLRTVCDRWRLSAQRLESELLTVRESHGELYLAAQAAAVAAARTSTAAEVLGEVAGVIGEVMRETREDARAPLVVALHSLAAHFGAAWPAPSPGPGGGE